MPHVGCELFPLHVHAKLQALHTALEIAPRLLCFPPKPWLVLTCACCNCAESMLSSASTRNKNHREPFHGVRPVIKRHAGGASSVPAGAPAEKAFFEPPPLLLVLRKVLRR